METFLVKEFNFGAEFEGQAEFGLLALLLWSMFSQVILSFELLFFLAMISTI